MMVANRFDLIDVGAGNKNPGFRTADDQKGTTAALSLEQKVLQLIQALLGEFIDLLSRHIKNEPSDFIFT
jgi:hypothetical protein